MTHELDLLKDVASRLSGAGFEYMVSGSMAMAVYAIPRSTRDIDMVVEVLPRASRDFINLFRSDFYIDAAAVEDAIRRHSMFNIIHNESLIKIDFIVRKDEEYRVQEFSRRQVVDIGGAKVSVVSPEDLILSKLLWAKDSGSELQMSDVGQLARLAGLDHIYLEEWAEKLGVLDLLNRAQTDA